VFTMLSKIEAQQLDAFRVNPAVRTSRATWLTIGNTFVSELAFRSKAKRVIPNALVRCST
jgi:hypothetical protein